jgi:predicted NodU family carbamoyl transferase
MPTRILGLSAYYHDSAACLVVDGRIVAAAQEERFTRKKHDAGFPSNAVAYCLREGGVSISEIDLVGFYEKPLVKFERLIETYQPQKYQVTILEGIYSCVEHFAQHTAQIIFATKLVTGQDMGFYKHLNQATHSENTP